MESDLEMIGWGAERVELKSELSRLEEELMESRAETEEFRSRTNVLTERLSQKLDSSISLQWESDQREWRKKLVEGKERESRQALLIRKLQQKVMEYRSRCEHLQQHMMTEEREMRVRERIFLDERSNNLETTLIRLEEEQQRSATIAEVNALLRSQLSQSAEENQTLQDDLKKLTSDWSKAVEEAQQKEMDWSKEKEVFSGYLEAERSRLMALWSRVVDLRRQCHAVKVATDKDLWELRAEFTRLSSTFLSLNVLPAISSTSTPPAPPPPPLCYTSGPMTLAELDHEENMKGLKSRLDDLTAIIKSQELERQRQDEAIKSSNKKEEKEQEVLQKKCREMETKLESVTQAIRKLYRVLDSQKSDGHRRVFPNGVLNDDLHFVLWVIDEAEGAFQWGHKELQEAEGKWHRLNVESESLQQQITELKTEREDLQKQASLEALELKKMKSLLRNETETTLSLKMQLDESERRSEDLKKENVRLIQERAMEDEERSGLQRERQKQMEAELLENANFYEQQSRTRTELHTLQVALEQERLQKARAEKELADCRETLAKTRESLLTLTSTHNLLQRETADKSDSLEKMASLNESLARDKRELSARNLQLEEEVTESQFQLQHFRSDVASLEKELNAVSEENTELRACRNADLHSLHLLRGREQELEGELQILTEEKQIKANALTEEEMKNEKLCEQYRSVSEELDTVKLKLHKAMDQVKKTQRENDELQNQKQTLEKHVHSMGKEKKEIQQDGEELRKLTGTLQEQLCMAKEQISVLEVENAQSQTQVHTLQLAKDVLHGEIKCLQSEVERNSILREEASRGAQEEQIQREKELEICQLEIRRLNGEAHTSLNNHRIHEEERTKWQIEREALNSELGLKDGEIEALKNRMDGLVKENEKLVALVSEKDGNVERLLSEIRILELHMREAKAETEQYREKVKAIESEKEAILEQVREDCEDLQKKNATMADILYMRDCELEKKSKRTEELLTSIRLQDSLIENLKLELEEKEIVIADQINNEKIKQKDWEAEKREKELKLKEELKKKDYEIEILSNNKEELKMEKQHMSHLLHERDTSIEKLKNKVIVMEQTYKERQDEMEWWKKKAGDVAREKEVLIKRVENQISVECERNELEDQLRERDKEIKNLKKKEQELVIDHERMIEENEKQETELLRRDREIEKNKTTILKMINEKDDQEKLRKEKNCLEEKKNQLEDGEQKMKEEIYLLREKIGELGRENMDVERNMLEHENQLQIQTLLLNEREKEVNRLRDILEQKEQQLMLLKDRLSETGLVLEEERNIQKEYDQKLQLESDKLNQMQAKVKELEVKNKSLTDEANVMRVKLGEQLKELETKSNILLENEENVKRFKLSIESRDKENENLKWFLKETKEEMEKLKIKLSERRTEEMLKIELEQQIHDLGKDLRRKDGVIDALKEKTDCIIKQKEEEQKQANEVKDAISTEVTKLRQELTILSLNKEKAEAIVKEQDIENKQIKDGLKAGLEEMVTLKLLLEESHSEGEKLRKVLEEKKKEMINGKNAEISAVREETEYLKHRVQILEKENQELQSQLNTFKLVAERLEEEGTETNRMRNNLEEQDFSMLKCEMEKKNTSLELVKDNLAEKRETDTMKKEMKESEKIKNVEILPGKETSLKIIPDFKEENARHLFGEQLGDTETETDILKMKMEREKQHVTTNLGDNIHVKKTHSQFVENSSIVNAQDFEMEEFHSPTTTTENTELQTKVYDINKQADMLRKDRDCLRTALEKNEAILIHYQEKAHQLEIKAQVASGFEEESQGRVCALQRAVAESELKEMKLQQRNERLEHRIKKLRLEKTNLRDALKQVVPEREKMRCQLSQTDSEIQDCTSPGSDELKCLRTQVHQLRLLLTSDHQKWADFIQQSLRNSKSLQTLRQDLNDSLTLVSKQLVPSVLECETQKLVKSQREEKPRNLLSHS